MTAQLPRPRSGPLTTGPSRAPARAMLRAVGLSEQDLQLPQVAVASSWNEVTPCNVHLDGLATAAKEGVRQAGAVPLEFGTIAVSDGISMGTEGMKASLVSREIIADSVELMMQAEQFDAMVTIAGCDKSLPGMLMACARLDLPAAFLYGGTILPGHALGRSLTIQDVFEAVGGHAAGEVTDADLLAIERAACPGAGSCAGMYTANTMSMCAEALGMTLPGEASPPAVSAERTDLARRTGTAVVEALAAGLRPRQIMTSAAFLNAATVVMATAGSTNAVLHLLAIAHEAGVELTLDDFDAVSRRTPVIASVRPSGLYVMSELDQVGGVPVILRELLSAGLVDGDAMTVNGRTLGQNVADAFEPDGQVVRPAEGAVPARRRPGGAAGQPGAERRGGEDAGHRDAQVRGARAGLRVRGRLLRRGHRAAGRPGRRPGDQERGSPGRARACARCWRSPPPSRAPGSAARWSWSPTGGSRAPRSGPAWRTPRRRPGTAGRSRWSATATASCWTSRERRLELAVDDAELAAAAGRRGSARRRTTPAGPWPSTRRWSPARTGARSARCPAPCPPR